MAQEGNNKNLKQLVAIVLVLAVALIALIMFYQKATKPPVDIEADIPPGIEHIKSIYGPAAGDNFNRPESTGIDDDGNMYVADTGNHRIVIFDSDGNYQRSIEGKKKMRFPLGVAVSKSGNVYVTSLMDHKLYIFNSKGSLKKDIKFKKKDETPIRVLVYKNKLYLTAIGQVIVADMNGKIEKSWGKEGRAIGSFRYPNGIVVGDVGKIGEGIIISDSNNNRIQILSMKGKVKAYLGQPPTSLKDESLLFGLPMGVTLDEEGRVFVVDSFNHSIRIFDKGGNDLGELGKRGSADGRFYYPTDIKNVDGNRFIVTDKWNDRIQIVGLTVGEAKTVSEPKK